MKTTTETEEFANEDLDPNSAVYMTDEMILSCDRYGVVARIKLELESDYKLDRFQLWLSIMLDMFRTDYMTFEETCEAAREAVLVLLPMREPTTATVEL
jgi:hypothetical protein